jgi:type VI protein secretion system component Hcp
VSESVGGEAFLEVALKNVFVSAVAPAADGSVVPSEQVSFAFGEVEVEVLAKGGGSTKAGWSFTKNAKA